MITDISDRGMIKANGANVPGFDISVDAWAAEKPHGLSGCFRVRNEEEWLYKAVASHIEYLDEAVLLLQHGDDKTFLEAAKLYEAYPRKVKRVLYPFDVVPIGTPAHFNLPETHVRHMVHMSNFALSCCSYSWICKVEADVVALDTFAEMRRQVDLAPSMGCYYGRYGLNIAGMECDKFSKEHPRTHGWDEAIFPNHPDYHFRRADKWEAMNLREHQQDLIPGAFSFLHTKRCKEKHQRLAAQETWLPFDREHLEPVLQDYSENVNTYLGPDGICPDHLFNCRGL